ncbi:MAG: phosphatidylglycerophosphatase A [Desulfobacterales bacterium]|jgi:phosphatidylglycerophosphatase A
MNFGDKGVVFLATGLYIGNLPFAPGTFGSLLGLPLGYFLSIINVPLALSLTLLFTLAAVWIANSAEKILKKRDPGCIVIDEVAGMIVTLIGMPFSLTTAVIGFIVFRAFDIIKPFPIRALEKKISGGAGIVIDDIIAGIFANLVLRIILPMVSM